MAGVAAKMNHIREVVRAAGVLKTRGIVDVQNLGMTIEAAKNSRVYGPQATMAIQGGRKYADLPAVADERGELTFGELDKQSNALARGLKGLGVEEGSAVGVLARDHRGLILTMCAAGKAGVRIVLMNTGFAKPQFAEVCKRENVKAVLHDSEFLGLLDALPPELPRVLTWVDDGHEVPEGAATIDSLISGQSTDPVPAPKKPGGFVILTSGTTGLPKGAPRSRVSPIATAQLVDRIPFPRKKTVVIVSPIFHSTGLATWLVSTALGNKTVTMRRFNAEATLKAIADHKADMLVAVPTMLHRMVELSPDVIKKYDTSPLRLIVVAGSALTPELVKRTQETFGDVLYNLYGSTECAVATVANPDELRMAPGTVGRSPVTCEVVLFDENDQRITEPNKQGRIFIRSGAPFEGYTDGRHKQIIDGYMSSGDTGHFDDNGLLFVDGRDDDMIVSGGENVFPQEVENLLVEREDVFDAAVIGVDDPEFGKRLRAFIVSEKGAKQDPEEIKKYVKDNLARYKVPRDVIFIDELPRNATGKLLRRTLAEMEVKEA